MTPPHVTCPDMDADYQTRFEVIDIETNSHSNSNNSGWEVVDSLYSSAPGPALLSFPFFHICPSPFFLFVHSFDQIHIPLTPHLL